MSWPVHSTWAARRHPKDKDTFKCPKCTGWGTYRWTFIEQPGLFCLQTRGNRWIKYRNPYNYWECSNLVCRAAAHTHIPCFKENVF
jgi:hypothetical protein